MSPECLKDACIELVTVNGRPFTLMEDTGFRKIIEPLQNAMGNNFVINSSNIRDMVSSVAQEGREELKNDLKGRLLMLKIDSATCRDRSVLGVNVQYTDGEKIVLRTLAVRELNDRHTAEYISSVVQDVLHEYDVELRQVYSITSDNGANMIKAVSLLSDIQEDTMCNEVNEADTMDKEEDGDETDIQDESQELVPDLAIELDSVMQEHVLRSVRCSAHTLQLAVDDALKEQRSTNLISKARRVAKKLRTQNVVVLLKRMGLKRAIVDCPTRWHSTHDMLERLLELKNFCQDMSPNIKEVNLSGNEWEAIANLVSALKPAKVATKSLQSEQLTAGDFYGVWLHCVLCTDRIDNLFAKRLVQCLKSRQTALFDNDAFVAALFLDPRYRFFLSDLQSERAKIHLSRAWDAIQNLSANNNTVQRSPSQASDDDDEIEQLLMAKEKEITTVKHTRVSVSSALDMYSREPRLKR
ncbi:hypothetical protein M9458_016794, partial [Cirrhinus mrigala]